MPGSVRERPMATNDSFAGIFRRNLCRAFLLAMQKVEGSNPFSRSLGSGSAEPHTTVSLPEVADFVTASLA